jgi:hypothetical protein
MKKHTYKEENEEVSRRKIDNAGEHLPVLLGQTPHQYVV